MPHYGQVRRACEFMGRAALVAEETADREAFIEEAAKLFRAAGRDELVAKAARSKEALSDFGGEKSAVACALECLKLGLLTDAVGIAWRSALTPHAKDILVEHATNIREAASRVTGAALQVV